MNATSSDNWKRLAGTLALLLVLSGCEAVELLNSVGTILTPSPSVSPSAQTVLQPQMQPTPSPSPSPGTPAGGILHAARIAVVKPQDPNPLSLDWNLVRQPNVIISVSSELNPTYDKSRLIDGKLSTSWFAAPGDTASLGKLPTVEFKFPQPVGIFGINLRGNREREEGLRIQELSLLISSPQGVLLNEIVALPPQHGDLNLLLNKPVDGATSLRLTFTRDSSETPGLAEIEVVGRF